MASGFENEGEACARALTLRCMYFSPPMRMPCPSGMEPFWLVRSCRRVRERERERERGRCAKEEAAVSDGKGETLASLPAGAARAAERAFLGSLGKGPARDRARAAVVLAALWSLLWRPKKEDARHAPASGCAPRRCPPRPQSRPPWRRWPCRGRSKPARSKAAGRAAQDSREKTLRSAAPKAQHAARKQEPRGWRILRPRGEPLEARRRTPRPPVAA